MVADSPANPWLRALVLAWLVPGIAGALAVWGSYGLNDRDLPISRPGLSVTVVSLGPTAGQVVGVLLCVLAIVNFAAWLACRTLIWQRIMIENGNLRARMT